MRIQQKHFPVVVVLAAIIPAVFAISLSENLGFDDSATTYEKGLIIGHITLVHKDGGGNIIGYLQTDNLVVDEGLDTIGDLVFPTIDLNGNATDGKFDWIGIGDDPTAPTATDNGEGVLITGCVRIQDGTVTGTSAVSGEITVSPNVQFSGGQCADADVNEAILVNSGTGTAADAGEVFARQTFADINLGASDTLDVTWDITFT